MLQIPQHYASTSASHALSTNLHIACALLLHPTPLSGPEIANATLSRYLPLPLPNCGLSREHIAANVASSDFNLTAEDVAALSRLNRNLRFVQPTWVVFEEYQ